MALIRVNLSLEKEVWSAFDALAPKRSKSWIINQLLKQEIDKLNHKRETEVLASAFKQAANDKKRKETLKEWENIDCPYYFHNRKVVSFHPRTNKTPPR